jgi:hypothetical protein
LRLMVVILPRGINTTVREKRAECAGKPAGVVIVSGWRPFRVEKEWTKSVHSIYRGL